MRTILRKMGVAIAILVGWGVAGCGASLSATDLGNLAGQDSACVQSAATKADADVCRAKVHAAFCTAHPGVGSMCEDAGAAPQKDAGAE